MRKFVIKNRQKRKYTKKSEEPSSVFFSRTVSGMLPMLILLLAFMATLVISAPLREQLARTKFTFALPEFSLMHPLSSAQAFATQMIEGSVSLWLALTALFTLLGNALTTSFTALDPRPLASFIGSSFVAFTEMLTQIAMLVAQGIAMAYSLFTQSVFMVYHLLLTSVTHVITSILTFGNAMWEGMSTLTVQIAHAIIFVSQTIAHFVLIAVQTVWSWFVAIALTIWHAITSAIAVLVHIIEIPFKVLGAFWEQIKPYVAVLGKHMQMSGNDLSNGFASWGKVASLMDSPK